MCKQHRLKQPETNVAAIVPTGAATPTTSFVACGLDRSCPASVTAMPHRDVRLDQYQCSIGTIRGQRDAKSSFNLSNNRVEEDDDFTILDHEFEWYDLDTIRGVDTGNTINVIGHDFRAGLVFTTERQVLNRGVEANTIVTSVSSSKNDIRTKVLDLLFWTNNSSDHNKVEETSEDREFREQIEELEQEIYSGDDLSSLSSSSSSLYGE